MTANSKSDHSERAWSPITRALPKRVAACDVFIDVPHNPWAGTYCKLTAGHTGDHSAHYPAASDEEQAGG